MAITDENEFHILVGEIMVWSARLESCLEACIAACLPGGTAEFSQPVLRRLNFTNQLATLREVSLLLYEPRDPTLVEFRRWLRRLGRIRLRRNDLVHHVLRVERSPEELGRWKSEVGYMREACAEAPAWVDVFEARMATTRESELPLERDLHGVF
jgi:hypothetical protein